MDRHSTYHGMKLCVTECACKRTLRRNLNKLFIDDRNGIGQFIHCPTRLRKTTMFLLTWQASLYNARCEMSRISNPHSKLALSRPGGEIGRHNGLKIRRGEISVPVQVRSRAPIINKLQINCDFQKSSRVPQNQTCSAK